MKGSRIEPIEKAREALPKLYKSQRGEEATPDMVEGLTSAFSDWYLNYYLRSWCWERKGKMKRSLLGRLLTAVLN